MLPVIIARFLFYSFFSSFSLLSLIQSVNKNKHFVYNAKRFENMKLSKTEILDLISDYYGFNRKREFANFLEISPATLTNWYRRKTFDYDIVISKCLELDLNRLFIENLAVSYHKENQSHQKQNIDNDSGELLSLLKEKDRQLLELSEKIGQLKEELRQTRQSKE